MNVDVVITGVGVVTPIGIGRDDFWQSLMDGVSGVRIRPEFAETDLPLKIYAPVSDFDGRKYVKPRKAMKVMCEPIQFGVASARMAYTDAGLDEVQVNPDRVATVFGTETFFADPMEVASVFRKCIVDSEYQHERWGEFAMRDIQPLWMLKYLPNMVASHISIGLDARGPSNSICQGEASGLLAIIEAADMIQRGVADISVAGGTGSRLSLTSMLYRGIDILSQHTDQPFHASRPFDLHRNGIVVGEGAGALVLESREHALARGAKPLASLAGYARSFCNSPTEKSRTIADCASLAIQRADLAVDDIRFVNANASSRPEKDKREAQAIQSVLGDTPVVANKGNFGVLGPGTSAVETISTVLSAESGKLPPTLNFESPDPECPVNVSRESRTVDRNTKAIKIAISAMGQIATVVIDSGR